MLNISKDSLSDKVSLEQYKSHDIAFHKRHFRAFNKFLYGFAILAVIILFLPWTQNVTGNGFVTTLTPDQRPQTVQSQIPGRIEKWYVREGDFVNAGDTILRISEIKTEYQDPLLVERTQQQADAKQGSAGSYRTKIQALTNQISALQQELQLKLEQGRNKVEQSKYKVRADSTDLIAIRNNFEIAQRQYDRVVELIQDGLKSRVDVEDKRTKQQEMQAKVIAQENKLVASRNDLINAQVELNRLRASYADKIAKAQSDRATAEGSLFQAQADVAKLENQTSSYRIRNSLYYVLAPQNGYINKAIKGGIGETFKEGEKLVGIMPADYDLAVETFVEPLDLPLIHLGEEVRVQFDGWPAIFFSGWPNASFGTYGGKVVAVETFITPENGKFRVLIAPDPQDHEWPENLRVGSGAYTIALLEDVPIWYEIWRQLNGFPPNYYQPDDKSDSKDKK
ncbi:MAG: HlyD family efflux transporter periplasmic adaptor subunit [Bacteroidota bacterium]|nr:HlyD family efflux transporter periplasmic adaptor subunit [Bacteroidota bacterium]